MENNELYHYGVKGMKWGVRRTPAQLGHRPSGTKTASAKAKVGKAVSSVNAKLKARKATKVAAKNKKVEEAAAAKEKKKKVSQMSDAELKERISRLQMEKQYKQLVADTNPGKERGKKFVLDVLESSGKNIAVQATTYGLGTLVNKIGQAYGIDEMVNPKKGQKDK